MPFLDVFQHFPHFHFLKNPAAWSVSLMAAERSSPESSVLLLMRILIVEKAQ